MPLLAIRTSVDRWLQQHADEVGQWFRHLHAHPELSHNEHETTAFLEKTLLAHGLQPRRLPGTGLVVDIDPPAGSDAPCTPRVAFRGDIDALPIVENTGLPYASTVDGVMHACGHDAHAAIILALACALASCREQLPCGVRCIFQPAEEVMTGGAPDVIAAGALQDVSAIYAVHAEPKLKLGQLGMRTGPITSAADVLSITVTGPGGHTSRPHMTVDVVYALSLLATQLPGLLTRRVDPRTGTVLVFGAIKAGDAPNAIPETGTLKGTIRTADIAVWRMVEPLLRELIAQILAPTGCSFTIDYIRGVPPVMNHDLATALMADAARSIDPHCMVEASQSSGGEDFSWYLEHVPGSMARLGCWGVDNVYNKEATSGGDLHRNNLIVDPRAIPIAVRLFAAIVDRFASTPD